MSNKKEKAAMTKATEKPALLPKLRFPEFLKTDGWRGEELEKLVTTVSPPVKLQTSSYLLQGKFPIIDQSQDTICGWTNDESTLITEPLPLIVFGDHTCTLKFVEKPFAQGADGIKILKSNPIISAAYLFQSLNHSPLVMEDYKRHFSILKKRVIYFPDVKTGEQQKIADCLGSIDELITLESQKLDALKRHKKGLIQHLFPAKGETVPRLRFPEFQNQKEWDQNSLAKVCNVLQGYGFPEEFQGKSIGKYPFCKVSDISRAVSENSGLLSKATNYVDEEDLLKLKAKAIPAGATVFAKIGEALKLNRRAYVQRPCLIDNNATGLKAITGISDDYFIYLLSQLIDLNQHCGGAVPSVNKSTLEKIPVVVPRLDEQKRIAETLSSIDTLITAQTLRVNNLKAHKKGLIQQLFPKIEGVAI